MMDTLTTFNWNQDQRRYLNGEPCLLRIVDTITAIRTYSLDTEGQALVIRLCRAMLKGSESLLAATAPIAHRVVYGIVRNLIFFQMLTTVDSLAVGAAGPLLTEKGSTALITIETYDPTLAAPTFDMQATLILVLDSISWRGAA